MLRGSGITGVVRCPASCPLRRGPSCAETTLREIGELRGALHEAGLGAREGPLLVLAKPSVRLLGVGRTGSAPVLLRGMPAPAVAIASGSDYAMALLEDGRVVAWGENSDGQLGNGTTVASRRPVPVKGLRGPARAIAAGGQFSLALLEDGGVVAWGSNRHGALGNGGTESADGSVRVLGLDHGVVAFAAGPAHSLALLADGSVMAWGFNANGALGDGTTVNRHVPVPVPGLSRVRAVAPGSGHSLALLDDGSVVAWGWNQDGRLGMNTDCDIQLAPAVVSGLPGAVRALAAGGSHSLALVEDGTVYAWGSNLMGQLGDGTTSMTAQPPARVQGLTQRAISIAAGESDSLALLEDGSVVGWGSASPYLGGPTGRPQPAPVPLGDGGLGMTALSAHARRSHLAQALGLRVDGEVVVWGGEHAHVENAADDTLALGATKLGGRPDLPPEVAWPTVDDRPQAFAAQVDLAEVAPFDTGHVLPPAGLLIFFYDQHAAGERGGGTVVFVPPGPPLERRAFPPELPADNRFLPVRLIAGGEISPPSTGAVQLAELGLTREEWDSYVDLVQNQYEAAGPVHRLLGHEDPVQESHTQALECQLASHGLGGVSYNDPRAMELEPGAAEWRLLLQVDSDSDAGGVLDGGGRLFYWMREDDLAARRFDKAWFIFQFS